MSTDRADTVLMEIEVSTEEQDDDSARRYTRVGLYAIDVDQQMVEFYRSDHVYGRSHHR